MLPLSDVIRVLELKPHPEGGHFRETFRDARAVEGRSVSTAMYYLLARGERAHWHRVDATEVWHYYTGAPMKLAIAADEKATPTYVTLGPNLAGGERPQVVVPAGAWQSAECMGHWSLVGCTVAPGFDFATFELAPPGWQPGDALPPPSPATGVEPAEPSPPEGVDPR